MTEPISWILYRHKKRPAIHYYVASDEAGNPIGWLPSGELKILAPRNVAFFENKAMSATRFRELYPPHLSTPSGLMPTSAFLDLYVKEVA